MPPLPVGDPLAHRALEALMRAEAHVRREVAAELARAGLSTGAFSVLVVLTTAGGELELRTLRRRLCLSKGNATEVTAAPRRDGPGGGPRAWDRPSAQGGRAGPRG